MPKLTEILSDLASVLLEIDDEGGEVTDDLALKLEACEEKIDEKVERIEHFCESLRAKAAATRERVKRLEAHARACEAHAARAHNWAIGQLEAMGLTKYETDSYSLAQRQSPPRLEITDEVALFEFIETYHKDWIKVERTIDKRAVLDMAKREGGLPGADIVRGTHWRVN